MARNECPLSKVAQILGRRWTLELIYYLIDRKRFCELQELVEGINPTTLTSRLRMLETEGLVNRDEIDWARRHVEYELTEKGKSLIPVIDGLVRWNEEWA